MSAHQKKYDLVLIGATGYTGQKAAQHISQYGPRNLKWAIAGRSESKLSAVIESLSVKPRALVTEPTRDQGAPRPQIEVVGDFVANPRRLDDLVKQTVLVVAAVGPYHWYGENVVKACATSGVHYVDCTGEVPWVLDMIQKYEARAVETGAVLIPQCGIDSAPADLLAWSCANTAQNELHSTLRETVNVCTEMSMLPSGGTVSTLFSLLESYSLPFVLKSMRPFALSPTPKKDGKSLPPLNPIRLLTGLWKFGGHKNLIETPLTRADGSQVGRSWGLHQGGRLYGPNFRFGGFLQMKNFLAGIFGYYFLLLVQLAIALPPLRYLAKMYKGPELEKQKLESNRLTYHAIANVDIARTGQHKAQQPLGQGSEKIDSVHTADSAHGSPKQVESRFEWAGDGYYLTGVIMAQAAFAILDYARSGKAPTEAFRPGFMTPSTLGYRLINNWTKVGIKFSSNVRSKKEE